MEPENKQSSHAVSANTKEKEQKRTKNQKEREKREKKRDDDCCESKAIGHLIGHIPDVLTEVVYELMIEWEVLRVTCIIDRKHRAAQEGVHKNLMGRYKDRM